MTFYLDKLQLSAGERKKVFAETKPPPLKAIGVKCTINMGAIKIKGWEPENERIFNGDIETVSLD